MKFKIEFKSVSGWDRPIELEKTSFGVDRLDQLRNLYGSKIPLEIIDGDVRELYSSPDVEINEKTARKSGRFLENATIMVKVARATLNRFCFLESFAQYDEYGYLKSCGFRPRLDESTLIEAWVLDGAPLDWTPTE